MSREPPSSAVPWVHPEKADPDGFVGVGGDLLPHTLRRAYAEGVFPWYNEGDPILWWSPHPRAVIELADGSTPHGTPGYGGLHVASRLARTIRSGRFRVTVNRCFERVMRSCGENRDGGTWVTPDMLAAYTELHRLGHAHSLETWVAGGGAQGEPAGGSPSPDGGGAQGEPAGGSPSPGGGGAPGEPAGGAMEGWELAGGVYGIAIGGLFAAESMFYRVTDGSKVALVELVARLRGRGFALLDVQMKTSHTTRMGATTISRTAYLRRLREAVAMVDVRFG